MNHHPEHDPLGDLSAAEVAGWLDDLSRELLAAGGLQSLVADRHVVGVTDLNWHLVPDADPGPFSVPASSARPSRLVCRRRIIRKEQAHGPDERQGPESSTVRRGRHPG